MAKKDTGKYANKEPSGSKEARNYDPQNTSPGGGGGMNIASRYSPAEQKPNSGPGNAPGKDRGS